MVYSESTVVSNGATDSMKPKCLGSMPKDDESVIVLKRVAWNIFYLRSLSEDFKKRKTMAALMDIFLAIEAEAEYWRVTDVQKKRSLKFWMRPKNWLATHRNMACTMIWTKVWKKRVFGWRWTASSRIAFFSNWIQRYVGHVVARKGFSRSLVET